MIVDSSAIVAIVRREPEAADFARTIAQSECHMSAANYVEAAVVIDSVRDAIVSRKFDDLIREAEISIEPVTVRQARSRAKLIATSAKAAVIPLSSTSPIVSHTR